jgi:hypothetical protein
MERKYGRRPRYQEPYVPEAMSHVPTDVFREIYKYQTPEDIVQFAASSKKNKEKVLADLRKYYLKKCSKATHNWEPLECLSSDECKNTCFSQSDGQFAVFLQKLPQLVGRKIVVENFGQGPEKSTDIQGARVETGSPSAEKWIVAALHEAGKFSLETYPRKRAWKNIRDSREKKSLPPTLQNLARVEDTLVLNGTHKDFTLTLLLDPEFVKAILPEKMVEISIDGVNLSYWFITEKGLENTFSSKKLSLEWFPESFPAAMASKSDADFKQSHKAEDESPDLHHDLHHEESSPEDNRSPSPAPSSPTMSKPYEFHYRGFSEARVPRKFSEKVKQES